MEFPAFSQFIDIIEEATPRPGGTPGTHQWEVDMARSVTPKETIRYKKRKS